MRRVTLDLEVHIHPYAQGGPRKFLTGFINVRQIFLSFGTQFSLCIYISLLAG